MEEELEKMEKEKELGLWRIWTMEHRNMEEELESMEKEKELGL